MIRTKLSHAFVYRIKHNSDRFNKEMRKQNQTINKILPKCQIIAEINK